jgi:uncharacterized SAM-binding protein YcdF (DUF218 family)
MGLVADALHGRAASDHIPVSRTAAVVVLGFPSRRNGRPHPVQEWRVKLALLTTSTHDAQKVVFSGGSPKGGRPEAKVMADMAGVVMGRTSGAGVTSVLVETESTSTWENVYFAAPMVEDHEIVILVSDPIHAARARQYWIEQRPKDVGRIFVTDCSPRFTGWWMKIPTAVIETVRSIAVTMKKGNSAARY